MDRLRFLRGMTFIRHFQIVRGNVITKRDWRLTVTKLGIALKVLVKGTK